MNWISVKTALPEHHRKVIAFYRNSYGKTRQVMGMHIERFKEESNMEDGAPDEYSEELDNYFYLEGWYEIVDNWGDYAFITIHEGTVTHWMPLPAPPEEE